MSRLRSLHEVLSVPNEVAAELATVDDGILDALRDRFGCSIRLRGNRLTLDGEEPEVEAARTVLGELVDLVEAGHAIGPSTVGDCRCASHSAHSAGSARRTSSQNSSYSACKCLGWCRLANVKPAMPSASCALIGELMNLSRYSLLSR